MKVFISEKADADLLQLYSYLTERDPTAAEVTLADIDKKFASLAKFPFIGRERSSLAHGVRSIIGECM